jgi:ABC-type uncharacterized transport system permease subunit
LVREHCRDVAAIESLAGIGWKGDSMGLHASVTPLAAYPAAILLAVTMPQVARARNQRSSED